MQGVAERTPIVVAAVARAAQRSGREPSAVTLVAVSKRKTVTEMREYGAAAATLSVPVVFGENYVQELKIKRQELGAGACIHLIGPLQSNKIKDAVRCADVIESVHSIKVVDGIAHEAQVIGKRQSILLQVNIGDDPRKSGFTAHQLAAACAAVQCHKDYLALCGLMTITPWYDVVEDARRDFQALHRLRCQLLASPERAAFEGGTIMLSMGMSADFEIAIEEGADIVRVGTAIFGERS